MSDIACEDWFNEREAEHLQKLRGRFAPIADLPDAIEIMQAIAFQLAKLDRARWYIRREDICCSSEKGGNYQHSANAVESACSKEIRELHKELAAIQSSQKASEALNLE